MTGSLKTEKAEASLRELNKRFQDRTMIVDAFYGQIEAHGVDPKSSVLVELVPDGSNTYIGKLIVGDGKVYAFDLDLTSPEFSQWNDVTEGFAGDAERLAKHKPWALEVLSWKIHLERSRLRVV